jgi:hypothetical protein
MDAPGRPLVDVERLIFLHMAQTAGTSLNDFVSGQFDPGEIFPRIFRASSRMTS